MKRLYSIACAAAFCAAVLLASGCRKSTTVIVVSATPTPAPMPLHETEGSRAVTQELEKYESDPSFQQKSRVQDALARVDGEVEAISKGSAPDRMQRAEALRQFRNAMQDRFLRSQGAIRTEARREGAIVPGSDAAESGEPEEGSEP